MSIGEFRYCPVCKSKPYVDHTTETLLVDAQGPRTVRLVTLTCGHQLIEELPLVGVHINARGLHPSMPWDTQEDT